MLNIVEGDIIVSEDRKVAEILNVYFSESVKSLDVEENTYILNSTDHLIDPIEIVLHKVDSHLSILKIRERVQVTVFSFSNTTEEETIREINNQNRKKVTTSNSAPVKDLKKHIDITGSILHKIINQEISNSHFPDKLKLAERSP